MEFFRAIYNGLAIIGGAVLAVVAVVAVLESAASALRTRNDGSAPPAMPSRVSVSTPDARPMRAPTATPVGDTAQGLNSAPAAEPGRGRTASLRASYSMPYGLEAARARGLLVGGMRSLVRDPGGARSRRTRPAWVEQHTADRYVLVTEDSPVVQTADPMMQPALQLEDGRRIPLTTYTDADGHRYAFARFCSVPPDTLRVIIIHRDSLRGRGSLRCP